MKNFNEMIEMLNSSSEITELSVANNCNSFSLQREDAEAAITRFLQIASTLNEGEFIALEFHSDRICSFSSAGINIGVEDYNWIFESVLTVQKSDTETKNAFADNKQRQYSIVSKNDDKEPFYVHKNYEEIVKALGETDAVLQFVVLKAEGNNVNCHILVSSPTEIPRRLQAVLMAVFRDSVIKELPCCDESASVESINQKTAINGFVLVLERFVDKNAAYNLSEGLNELLGIPEDNLFDVLSDDDQGITDDTKTAKINGKIEELDLSVRSYNCLKRAGVNDIETLNQMSDYELSRIRNLGVKNIEEIRSKIDSYIQRCIEREQVEESLSLDEMVGLENVKTQVKKIQALARLKKHLKSSGNSTPVSLNMAFVGNPGTAKTTVARILAEMLYKEGLLSDKIIVEVSRADLIGEYIGQTAPKVKSAFEKAKGRLLFIDEAYSLVDCHKNSYGDEAINTIILEMENNRNETIVVFAGYPREMEELFSRNPGFKSRVPFKIEFEDYSVNELTDIVKLQAQKMGFEIQQDAVERIEEICTKAKNSHDFGNGRFCRNLFENAILSYALRVFTDESDVENDFQLLADDFSFFGSDFCCKEQKQIGFVA